MRLRQGNRDLTQQDVEDQLKFWRGKQRAASNQDELNEATEQINRMLELWATLQPVAYG
jgi:hypothetical protein